MVSKKVGAIVAGIIIAIIVIGVGAYLATSHRAPVSTVPVLTKVLWLGCDGFAGSPAVYKVCPVAVKVKLLSTVVGLPESRMNWLKERVLKEHPGVVGTWEYASIEYDAVWIVALSALKSYLDKGTLNTTYINQILPEVAYLYSIGKPIPTAKGELVGPWVTGTLWGKGALTGVIKLDKYHDRMGANYNIYAVVPSTTGCTWKLVGMWNMQTGKIIEYVPSVFNLSAYMTSIEASKPATYVTFSEASDSKIVANIKSNKITTITIGFLLPLTGGLSSDGVLNKYVAQIAIHDINSWLENMSIPYRFTAAFYDTATSYTGAIKAFEAAVSAGIKLIVGPMSSLALSAIYKKAEADRVIVVSQSSTAMSLHVIKPYVFRLAPPDMWQSKALATIIKDLGIKAVCIIYRVDPWGKGLTEYLEMHLKQYGIQYKAIGYPPTASTYTSYVEALKSCVKSFASKYGYKHVAVEAITFDEIAYILRTAASS